MNLFILKESIALTKLAKPYQKKHHQFTRILRPINSLKGLLFCPLCLLDPVPCFKKEWRYNISFICARHKIFLQNKCPSCNAPVLPLKTKITIPDEEIENLITLCHKCKKRLGSSAFVKAPEYLIKSQKKIYKQFDLLLLGKRSSILYFERLLFLLFILNSKRRDFIAINNWLYNKFKENKSYVDKANTSYSSGIKIFYSVWLLKEWPKRLQKILSIIKRKEEKPYYVNRTLNYYLKK